MPLTPINGVPVLAHRKKKRAPTLGDISLVLASATTAFKHRCKTIGFLSATFNIFTPNTFFERIIKPIGIITPHFSNEIQSR